MLESRPPGNRAQFALPGRPARVPAGDHEIAWIHTTTNPQTWERSSPACCRPADRSPVLKSRTRGPSSTSRRPSEVVVSQKGGPGSSGSAGTALSSEVGNRDWVTALAAREPPPLAFMGGGTSDRAIELAVALDERENWTGGPRPLLFITTATANLVDEPETGKKVSLLSLYPGRTFRGCFTNKAMAEAVVDFVWSSPDDTPTARPEARAHVIAWQDDPYSVDLADEFVERFRERKDPGFAVKTVLDRVPYSVGTFTDPNPVEREVINRIIPDVATGDGERSLLVLPAVTQPARRILRAFAADSPLIGKHLVAVTGDGVSFNTTFRDADVAWPVRELSIPLVFFAHQNPVAWDSTGDQAGVPLHLRNSTDDVLLFADEVQVLAEAVFGRAGVANADQLAARLRAREPAFFTPAGERRPGAGEHVVVVRPQFLDGNRVAREAVFDVYARREGKWERVQRLVK